MANDAALPPRAGPRVGRRLATALAVGALLALAFGLQARFFERFPQPSLFGDPAGYYAIGQTYRDAFAAVRLGGSLAAAFERVRGSFEFLGIGLLFALLPSDRPADVAAFRLALAGVNTLGMLGACLLARRLSGSLLAGLLAIVLAALHCSFSCDTGRLYPEPVVGCLSVWAAYFYLRGLESRRTGWMAAAGLALSGALFVRAKLMPYLLALLALVLLATLRAWWPPAASRRLVTALLLGGLPLVALWAGARRVATGPVDAKAPEWNLPARQYYPYGFWQYLDSDGWEGPYRLKTEPYYEALQAAGRDDPVLLRSRARQYLFTARYIAERPVASLLVVLDNAWRLYDRPHNPYRWDYPLDYGWALLLHRAVVVLGLCGCLLAALQHPARTATFFVPLSLLVVYGFAFPYPRYALPGLLILVASAAAFAVACARHLAQVGLRAPVLRAPGLTLAAGLLLLGLGRLLFLARPEWARALGWLGLAAALGAPLLLAAAAAPAGGRRFLKASLAWGALASLLAAHAVRDRSWHETEIRLGGQELAVRQEITLGSEALATLQAAGEAFVAFDLSVPRGDLSGLSLTVAGRELPGSELLATMPRFPEQTTTGGRDWRGYRQWWVLPLAAEWLPAAGQPLVVELRAAPGQAVLLRGDRHAHQQRAYEGPSFGDWPNLASSKLEYEGDYRLPVRRPLESLATRSFTRRGAGDWRPQVAAHRIRVITLASNEGWLSWRTPALPRAPFVALEFAASSLGRGRTAEISLGTERLRGLALGSETDFVVAQGPRRLCFQAGGRRGDQPWGSYLLLAPGSTPGAALPMSVRFFTGLRDEAALFALDTRAERLRPALWPDCPLPPGTVRVDAFGGELDARHNNYPQDTGRWRVEHVF